MKRVSFLLASLGMCLTRRFGSVRPGEVLTPFEEEKHSVDYYVTVHAANGDYIGTFFCDYFTRGATTNFIRRGRICAGLSSDVVIEAHPTGPKTKYVITKERLLVGRENPHEATPPTEANPS